MTIITLTVIIGILVLALDLMLSYGGILFWQEEQKAVAVIFFITIIAMTAFFVDIVIRMYVE